MFKECTVCFQEWETLDDFIMDNNVLLLGYQSTFTMGEPGLFLFNHSCGSTVAVNADLFSDLYGQEIYHHCEDHLENHPEYCYKEATGEQDLKSCVCKFATETADRLRQIMAEKPLEPS